MSIAAPPVKIDRMIILGLMEWPRNNIVHAQSDGSSDREDRGGFWRENWAGAGCLRCGEAACDHLLQLSWSCHEAVIRNQQLSPHCPHQYWTNHTHYTPSQHQEHQCGPGLYLTLFSWWSLSWSCTMLWRQNASIWAKPTHRTSQTEFLSTSAVMSRSLRSQDWSHLE